jgi:hypothetical protein
MVLSCFSLYRHLVNCNDALKAEISAAMEGVVLALEWSAQPFIIQSDRANVLSFIRDPGDQEEQNLLWSSNQ